MRRILALLAVVAAAAGCGDGTDGAGGHRSPAPAPASAVSATPALPDVAALTDLPGARTFGHVGDADWVILADGRVWIANVDGGVGWWDADTAERGGTAGKNLVICTQMAATPGAVWALDCPHNRLVRIDTSSGAVTDEIDLGVTISPEGSLAASNTTVYAATLATRELVEVDARRARVVGRLKVPANIAGVRYAFDSLWASQPPEGSVARIDPDTGRVIASVEVGIGDSFLDVDDDAVWVMSNYLGQVSRIEPDTNRVSATIAVSGSSVDGGDLTTGGGRVFARVSDALVAVIDPATDEVTARIGAGAGSGSADGDGDAVWISAHDQGEVYRVPLD